MKPKRKTDLKKRVWKKLNKQSTPSGSLIYTKVVGKGSAWVGLKKYPKGWMVRTPVGLQKPHFKTKAEALKYMKSYMRKHK